MQNPGKHPREVGIIMATLAKRAIQEPHQSHLTLAEPAADHVPALPRRGAEGKVRPLLVDGSFSAPPCRCFQRSQDFGRERNGPKLELQWVERVYLKWASPKSQQKDQYSSRIGTCRESSYFERACVGSQGCQENVEASQCGRVWVCQVC